MSIVPFFVADRPMSLRLLKGLPLAEYPEISVGIMAHANTSKSFQQFYHDYPCDDIEYCDAIGGPCPFRDRMDECPTRRHILEHTIKMCDSGIFTKEGATLNYDEMFEAYQRMGVQYGIMIDVFLDAAATLESAALALQHYEPYRDVFKLVGVAQGTNLQEYLDCYASLKAIGFEYVAVGGLLRRRNNTVRTAYLRNEDFMFEILRELRRLYPDDWLFALGTFHPNRLQELSALGVWADYKGWIFQYEKKDDSLNSLFATLATNHLEHLDTPERQRLARRIKALKKLIVERDKDVAERATLSQQLFDGRRLLRADFGALHAELQAQGSPLAPQIATLATHGLPDDTEERRVAVALRALGKPPEEIERVLQNILDNRTVRADIKAIEARLTQSNGRIQKRMERLLGNAADPSEELREFCTQIGELIQMSEQEHRFRQVRGNVASAILSQLEG